jgi:hypothetical protein
MGKFERRVPVRCTGGTLHHHHHTVSGAVRGAAGRAARLRRAKRDRTTQPAPPPPPHGFDRGRRSGSFNAIGRVTTVRPLPPAHWKVGRSENSRYWPSAIQYGQHIVNSTMRRLMYWKFAATVRPSAL